MLFVGLLNSPSLRDNGCFNKRLLLATFSVSRYFSRFVLRPQKPAPALFPGLSSCANINLANTSRGRACACAADDFELSLSGENGQIEIFDNYVPEQRMAQSNIPFYGEKERLTQFRGRFDTYDMGYSVHDSSSAVDDLSPGSYSSNQSLVFNYILPPRAQKPVTNFHAQDLYAHRDNSFDSQEHAFAMPAVGFDGNPFFSDFGPACHKSASFSSSIESFDSPLDDMFFSRSAKVADMPVSRKRRQDSHELQFDSALFQAQKQQKVNKKLKTEPFLQFERESFVEAAAPVENVIGFPQQSLDDVKSEDDDRLKARYACTDCDAVFKVKSYLTRHSRKHNNAKAFVCPFYDEGSTEADGEKAKHKCHSTGGFSRKDTYKTHLKALHFIYPPRTKSSERSTLGGRCAGCFQYFESNSNWFKYHIEGGKCAGFAGDDTKKIIKQEMLD